MATTYAAIPSGLSFGKQGQAAVLGAAQNLGGVAGPATAAPSFSGSSTKLTNAGTTGYQIPSPNLPSFTLNQQGNITPPPAPSGPPAGYSGPPANVIWPDSPVGPGGIMKGDYDARTLTQDQRQWLFEQFGHQGQAPTGYGGERPPAPPTPPAAPPPTLPAQTQAAAKPIGATAQPASIGKLGTAGSTVAPALTQAGTATKGLQMPGLSLGQTAAPSAQLAPPKLPTTPGVSTTPEALAQLQGGLESKTPPIVGGIRKALEDWNRAQQNIHIGSWGLPELGITEKISSMLPGQPETRQGGSDILRGRGIPKFAAPVEGAILPQQIGTPGALSTFETTPTGGLTSRAMAPGTGVSQQNLMTNLNPQQRAQTIQSVASGQIDPTQAAPAVTNPDAPAEISKAITQAQRVGDMGAVGRLADLHAAVQQQLTLIHQIGQAVLATSQGFGTQNAPGVTEARMPMVEQGIGQALTTPMAPTLPQQDGTNIAAYLAPRLQDVAPVSQNKPVLYPYTK